MSSARATRPRYQPVWNRSSSSKRDWKGSTIRKAARICEPVCSTRISCSSSFQLRSSFLATGSSRRYGADACSSMRISVGACSVRGPGRGAMRSLGGWPSPTFSPHGDVPSPTRQQTGVATARKETGMLIAVLAAGFWWAVFVWAFRRDRRRVRNGLLLLIAVHASISLVVRSAKATLPFGQLIGLAGAIMTVLGVIALGIFLVANGLTMARKEGRTLGNLLSGLAGLALLA